MQNSNTKNNKAMRCNNCGYDNDANVSMCIKCGHQLQSGAGYVPNQYQGGYVNNGGEAAPRPTVVGAAGMAVAEPAPRPTVVNASASVQQVQPRPTVVQSGGSCPKCGYPLMDGFSSCPRCGATVDSPTRPAPKETDVEPLAMTTCDKCGKEVSATFAYCPYCSEKIQAKTVFVRRHHIEAPKPKCSLTLVPEKDEQKEAAANEYEGASVLLKRENTEPDNRSITSKEQAELICENGTWYILNHSELCSTAVEANRKIALEPGDIIVLGDRRFKFEVK